MSAARHGVAAALRSRLPPQVAFSGAARDDASKPPAPHPEELKTLRAPSSKRLGDFAWGRFHARAALGALGAPSDPLPMGGDRAPVWPEGMVGSISHCEGYCAAIVARRRHVSILGLDLECAEPLDTRAAALVCVEDEITDLARRTGLAPGLAATVIFSLKESVYKALAGRGAQTADFTDLLVETKQDARFVARAITETGRRYFGARPIAGGFGLIADIVFSYVAEPA